jgi:hypothetical protein
LCHAPFSYPPHPNLCVAALATEKKRKRGGNSLRKKKIFLEAREFVAKLFVFMELI